MRLPLYIRRDLDENIVQEAVILNRENVSFFKGSTSLKIAPSIVEATELKLWYQANKERIDKLFNPEDFFSTEDGEAPPNAVDFKNLEEVVLMPSNMTFWTKVLIHLVNYNQHFFYLCCVKCKKSTGSNHGDIFTCNYCGLQKAVSIPRCLIEFELRDETFKILARAYAEVAEKIVNCTAQEIMEAIKNGGQEVVKRIVDMKFDAMVLVKIKTSQNHFEQNGLKRYSISDVKLPRNRQKTVEPEK